jgi:hypothetical protein
MRKYYLILMVVGLAIATSFLFGGCKNSDNSQNPEVPNPHGPGGTVEIDPNIPEPFVNRPPTDMILDIALEGDGDVVLSFDQSGLWLYTPYGVFKRVISQVPMTGLVSANFGILDTGRGIMGISPSSSNCAPAAAYDDQYVTGGVPYVTYDQAWWQGEPDPYYPDVCVDIASTSQFESCAYTPAGINYHPTTGFAYQTVYAGDCIADSDCQWPISNTIPDPSGGYAILAYHPDAPLPPDYMSMIFEGGQDFLVYYDYPVYQRMQGLAAMVYGIVPACATHNLYIAWDLTAPNMMLTRSGMEARNIADFEFDTLNRMIMVLPNADSAAITDPVVFNSPIVIQKVIGGRQNGMGTLPGEFQGPRAVAIDPRNQNILISDTGNRRVQVFDNAGNFLYQFGAADQGSPYMPGAIRVDAFGTIYVANVDPARATGDNLRIYNENGEKVTYGTIEGWVYDKISGQPVDNVRVRVMSTFMPLDAITDGNGHFVFPAVAAGTWNVAADKWGYKSSQVNVSVTGGYKSLVDIYLEKQQIAPPGYGQVTGTVMTSLYNEPQPNVVVEIVGQPVSNTTNGNGEFTLYNVVEGEQILRMGFQGVIYYEKYITVTKGEILDIGIIYLPIP